MRQRAAAMPHVGTEGPLNALALAILPPVPSSPSLSNSGLRRCNLGSSRRVPKPYALHPGLSPRKGSVKSSGLSVFRHPLRSVAYFAGKTNPLNASENLSPTEPAFCWIGPYFRFSKRNSGTFIHLASGTTDKLACPQPRD